MWQKLEMENVSKVISVLEEAADMLKSGQTESSSSSSSADQGPSSRALSNRSEPRNFSRVTTSTHNINTQVGAHGSQVFYHKLFLVLGV